MLLHLDFSEKVERCEEDGLSSLLALFSYCNESVLKDGVEYVLHQFRRNCYSTKVSLNCSKVQDFLESSQYSNLVLLLPSWMCRSQSFSWEISCSFVRERIQQFRPYRVPMNCCIRLSFFLIIVTHQYCNQFGDRCWKRSFFVRWISRNEFPLPFLRRNGSCCVAHWAGRNTDGVRILFPGAGIRGRTSFLDACLRLLQARFTVFSVFMFRVINSALVRSCLTFGICNSSTNRLFPLDIRTQGVRFGLFGDVISISSPMLSKTFTMWTSMTGPKFVSPRIAANALHCGFARGSVLLAQWDGISKNVVLVRFGLVAHTSRYPVPDRCELANLCELNRLGQWFEVLNVFPQTVSRC